MHDRPDPIGTTQQYAWHTVPRGRGRNHVGKTRCTIGQPWEYCGFCGRWRRGRATTNWTRYITLRAKGEQEQPHAGSGNMGRRVWTSVCRADSGGCLMCEQRGERATGCPGGGKNMGATGERKGITLVIKERRTGGERTGGGGGGW